MAANEPIRDPAPPQAPCQSAALSFDRFVSVLWESAVESFVRAILVMVCGGIAIRMASGIWQEMAPSRPPGFGSRPEAEAPAPKPNSAWGSWIGEHHFVIVFGLIFALTVWFRLTRGDVKSEEPGALFHLGTMGQHLSENWFGLIIGNALGALISAFVVAWVQQFTFANMIFHWLLESVLARLQSLVQGLFGGGGANALQAWLGWYGDNQLKFAFWFFYLSAICDDFGIPNLKTLGTRLLRRLRHRCKRRQEPST